MLAVYSPYQTLLWPFMFVKFLLWESLTVCIKASPEALKTKKLVRRKVQTCITAIQHESGRYMMIHVQKNAKAILNKSFVKIRALSLPVVQ